MDSTPIDVEDMEPHFTYIWSIENASTLTLSTKILSPMFVAQPLGMSKWHLEIKFDGVQHELMLFICKDIDDCMEAFEIDFEVSLIGSNETPFAVRRGTSQFEELGNYRCQTTFDEGLTEYFPNETLTVRCRISRIGCEVLQSDMCFARSHLAVDRNSFVWAIRRFSDLQPGQTRTLFLHPTFEALPTLILTFFLEEKDGEEYGNIAIRRSPMIGSYLMDAEVFILDNEGFTTSCPKEILTAWITHEDENVCKISDFFEKAYLLSNSGKFLPNDVLSLKWEFDINAGPLWSRIESYRLLETPETEMCSSETIDANLNNIATPGSILEHILKSLYEDGTLSEITPKNGSWNFHKKLIAVRSPFLKALLAKDSRMNIFDFDWKTLRRLLIYIHTNRVENLKWKSASDLYRAAAKFRLMNLREKCSDFLKANISSSNIFSILVLAYGHHDVDLQSVAQNFILQNLDIFGSITWKNFKEEHAKLAFETTEIIICKMKDCLTAATLQDITTRMINLNL